MEKYFADGPQIHMLFNFLLNQRVFLALARGEATPIVDLLKELPDRPTMGQFGNFLRNHDELSLDRLSDSERDEVFAAFGPKQEMQAYGRGIRRRLAPMFGGDLARQKLAYSLTLTLPGTPVLRYGDEIGMGDDLSLQERLSVRTPMQWCASKNGGFSEADPERLIRPAVTRSDYGFDQVNVADQDRDPESLLNWMEHALRIRKICPEFGWGDFQVLNTGHRSVFAHRCEFQQGAVIAVHNLSADTVQTSIKLDHGEHLLEVLGENREGPCDHSPKLNLQGYEFRWFRVRGNAWRDF